MKKQHCKLLLLLFFILSASMYGQATQNFRIVNSTGLAIDSLFISPNNVLDWQEDVLGVDILADGEACDINFHPSEDECIWDIRIVDEEGDAIIWDGVDLCAALEVTLYWKDGNAWAEVKNVEAE